MNVLRESWDDEAFISYCEMRSQTEHPIFRKAEVCRIYGLAGLSDTWREQAEYHTEFIGMPAAAMKLLTDAARKILSFRQPPKVQWP